MISLLSPRPKKPISWTLKRRAYPLLILQIVWLYCRSAKFRLLVRMSFRHRRFLSPRLLHKLAKGYLLLNHSRLNINGFGTFSPWIKPKVNKTFWRIDRH